MGRDFGSTGVVAVAIVIFVVLAALFGGSAGFISDIREGTLMTRHGHENYHPADAAGITFIIDAAQPGDIVVETADGSYGYNDRVSALNGLPTIVGWVGHEARWRSGGSDAGTR